MCVYTHVGTHMFTSSEHSEVWDWVRALGRTTGLAGTRRSQRASGKSRALGSVWSRGGRGREERECEMKRLVQGHRASSTAAEGGAGPGRDISSEGWLLFYPLDDGQGPLDSDRNGPVGQEAWVDGRRKGRPHGARAGSRLPRARGTRPGLSDKRSPRVSPGRVSP